MRFGSVCSGIEAASVAFGPLGWKAAWLAEIESFPSSVLAHHYPEVPNLGDMTLLADRIDAEEIEAPDLLCGGCPCQSFSVAGLRRSLGDERGNLTLEFIRIADAIDRVRRNHGKRPAWVLYENVPGILNTKDNAFGAFLGGLCGGDTALDAPADGWPGAGVVAGPGRVVAWRVLDAQYFGVPQRRRRVFVLALGGSGGWACADALLSITDSLSGHPAPSRQAGQGFAASTAPSLTASGRGVERTGETRGQDPVVAVSMCLNAKGGGGRLDAESETLIPTFGGGFDVAHALTGEGFDASEDGTGRGTPLVPVAYAATDYESGAFDEVDQAAPLTTSADRTRAAPILAFSAKDHGADAMQECSPTLRAGGHSGSHANAGVMPAIAYSTKLHNTQSNQAGKVYEEYTAGLDRNSPPPTLLTPMQVRRLTPRECERLQGFPDDYTLIPHNGKPAADGPRYKAIGNSWAVPCAMWIGERINKVEALA